MFMVLRAAPEMKPCAREQSGRLKSRPLTVELLEQGVELLEQGNRFFGQANTALDIVAHGLGIMGDFLSGRMDCALNVIKIEPRMQITIARLVEHCVVGAVRRPVGNQGLEFVKLFGERGHLHAENH